MMEIRSKKDGSAQVLLGRAILKEKPARKRFRGQWAFSIEMLRVREIELIIRRRHGNGIPDPEGSDDTESCLAYLRAVAMTPGAQDLASWAAVWAPWADAQTVESISSYRLKRKRMLAADAVAKMLFVSMAERSTLSLKTIGACDTTVEERQKLTKGAKRDRDKRRQEQKRRANGVVPRASYEAASISRLKPWRAEGMSRAEWYRRRETSPSRVEVIRKGDTLVSKPATATTKPDLDIDQARAAGLIAGLGDDPPAEFQEAAPHGSGEGGLAA